MAKTVVLEDEEVETIEAILTDKKEGIEESIKELKGAGSIETLIKENEAELEGVNDLLTKLDQAEDAAE